MASKKEPVELGNAEVLRYATSAPSPFNYDLGSIQTAPESGMDAFLSRNQEMVTPLKLASRRVKVSSLQDLAAYTRVSNETLVHRSNRDLWAIRKEADGLVIERLFDDVGEPLKG